MSYSSRFGFDFQLPDEGWCYPKNDMHFIRSEEWVPVEKAGVGRSFANPNGVIYPRVVGMIPRYGGHVPGNKFRVGNTYGRSTIDAKRHLSLNHD
ncbi:protein FAM166B [Drosophila gunungcola]|uniref:protein FAM166B n=1 Tax=Drosophila gunungcola TaxID=103775 RepID=UPI0022E47EBB|nr:protein FAM166B [Drosophila gunungcola]